MTWSLGKAGIPPCQREFLAEDALQEALLEILREGPAPEETSRETQIKRAAWRTTARILRRRKQGEKSLEGEPPVSPSPEPWEEAEWVERRRDLLSRLEGDEKELFRRILEGDVPFKSSGAIHRSALAEEMGMSRRTLGRKLESLGRRFAPSRRLPRKAERE